MNMRTGTFYRNRDFVLIMRRMTTGNELSMGDLLNILSC
jgi:hypothetical protein